MPQTNSQLRSSRAAQRQAYAPRPKNLPPTKPSLGVPADKRVRELTVEVLEALKRPGAVPSQVIMAALLKARTLA